MDTERYDRNMRFFGKDGQQRLAVLQVAVVGIGGLGTHVVQQLALLGVGHLVLIDPEEVDHSNRNRYVGVRYDDPVPGSRKVDIGGRIAREINPQVRVTLVPESLISQQAFDAIVACDYVFGCVDEQGARLVLNELCAAYEKPYFDLASDVLIEETPPRYGGRVCTAWDGHGCIICYGELDVREAQADLSNTDEAQDRKDIYGVPRQALGTAGPSVVSINGVVASIGVTEFMLVSTGVLTQPRKLVKYYADRGIVTVSADRPIPDCYYCVGVRGKGDTADVQRYLLSR